MKAAWTVAAVAVCVVACVGAIPVLPEGTPDKSLQNTPGRVVVETADDLRAVVAAVADTWMADHEPNRVRWAWGEGVLAFGMVEAYRATGDERYREYIREYVLFHQERDVRIVWSDSCSPAIAAVDLALKNNDTDLLPVVTKVVDYIMTAPRTEVQNLMYHLGLVPIRGLPNALPDAWVDTLYHVQFTLARYSTLFQDPSFFEEGIFQVITFFRNLQDPATGLITHAYNDFPLDQHVPEFDTLGFWARGNGWMIATCVDTLDYMPEDHPVRVELLDRLRIQEAALRKTQTERGLFRTVLLNETTYEETAGSALITYGMIRGARLGIFGSETLEAGRKGMDGLISVLETDGDRVEVSGTSVGTNPYYRLYPYIRQKNQVSYGVGSWLMAAREYLLLESESK